MTDPIVPPVDPNAPVEPAPVEPVIENDDELDPGVIDPAPPDETPEQMAVRLADLEARNTKLWNRLQREKNKSKTTPPAAPVVAAPAPTPAAAKPALSHEEAVLIAQGKSLEEVEYAKKVAELQKKPLLEAVTDSLYTTWETQTRKEANQRAAQLGAGRGGRTSQKKSFASKDLSDDEHREMFQEKLQG